LSRGFCLVKSSNSTRSRPGWLNGTVLGVGLASLFSDLSHETATALLPAFLVAIGGSAAALGIIEGVSDAVSSFAKIGGGWWSDRMPRRKPLAVVGYIITSLAVGSFALAHNVWQVGISRMIGWFGRGMRTPARKALLAGAVSREYYGRAFGLERAMDETGGLLGAVAAALLVGFLSFRSIFLWTLVPGALAALAIALLVREKERATINKLSLAHSLRELPDKFRRFLFGVALFGAGDFAKSMLILLATLSLTPTLGTAKAASMALVLYILHKVFYMSCSYPTGHLGDHFDKRRLLAGSYALAAAMGLLLMFAPMNLSFLVVVFVLSGIYAAGQDALEDSLTAELVDERQHGMAFGTLATVNGVGDFFSSVVVGLLWTQFSPATAFGYATLMFISGTMVIWRLK